MLKTRVLTATFLLVGLFLTVFYLPQDFWLLLVVGIAIIAAWEWANISGFTSEQKWTFTLLATALILALMTTVPGQSFLYSPWSSLKLIFFIAVIFWLLVAPWWLISRWQVTNKFVLAITGLAILVPFAFALIYLRFLDPRLLIALMGVVWVADIAAYFTGKKFGKHKLAPRLSPGKTWEGVFGALIGAAIYGSLVSQFTGVNMWQVILVTCLLTVLSILGDLFESMMKRQSGLKDSSRILPGHGGLLDRVDALTSTLPVAAFAISLGGFF